MNKLIQWSTRPIEILRQKKTGKRMYCFRQFRSQLGMMCEGLIDGEVRVMRRDRFQVTIEKVVWAKRNQTLHQLAEQEKINGGPSQ